jgi:aryl-alcohol dehydrogenase-like predicted oxidoreductase
MPFRELGGSGAEVSALSLGSWKTFERLSRDQGAAVMRRARDAGISFLDDARYNDDTGTAPIPSGFSEVVFGQLFRATWERREDVVVANKLWWEFWPQQSAADEIDASLDRLGFEHIDLIYALPPPAGLEVDELVASVTGLITAGKARMWGVANWPADLLIRALRSADAQGAPRPCAAQLPYSLVQRAWVEDEPMATVLADEGVGLVASYSLAGGTLTDKYRRGETGRVATDQDNAVLAAGRSAATQLAELASAWGVTEAALAIAFALAHPQLSSVLFGATTPAQIDQNVESVKVLQSLDRGQIERLRMVGGQST